MITRRKLLGIWIFLLTSTAVFAQEKLELVGRVIDKETQEPLPYCTILNKSNKKISITNVNGDFRLGQVNDFDTIKISMVGFEQANIIASNISKHKIVELSPSTIMLDEVIVRSLDFKKYIPKVYNKIEENFPAKYPTFDGIYRKQLLEDGKYVFLGECEISCKNTKKYRNSPKVYIGQTYATVNKTHNAKKVFLTLYSNLILYPYLYFITDVPESNVEWKFLDTKINEDESSEVYIFSYKIRKGEKVVEDGTVQINALDDAVLRVDRNLYPEDNFISSLKDFQLLNNKMAVVYKYKKNEEGNYVLNYSRSEWSFKFAETEDEMHEYILTNDFLVTNYNSKHKRISTNASIDPFKKAKEIKVVDISKLKHLIPDYELD